MKTNPCKDCQDRHAGCHGTCKEYKAWRAELDEARARETEERNKDYSMSSYYADRKERKRKHQWRKET